MNMTEPEENFEIPERLRQDLQRLPRTGVFIPPAKDHEILEKCQKVLAANVAPRRTEVRRLVPVFAMAGCLAFAFLVYRSLTHLAGVLNGDGQVDVLDALLV